MDQEQPASLVERARALLCAGDAEAAEAALRGVVALDSSHAAGLHLLGLLAGRAGRDAECIAWLERAIAAGSDEEAARSGELLGTAHGRAGRAAEAEAAFRAALQRPGAPIGALTGLAALLREQRRPAEAEAMLRGAGAAAETLPVRYELGLALLDMGRVAEAASVLSAVVAADPESVSAQCALSAARLMVGDFEGAGEAAGAAVALAPGDPRASRALAAVALAQGRPDEAVAICRRALANADAALLNTLGVSLKAIDDLDGAAGAFEAALTIRPDYIDALFNLAGVRKDQGRTDEAMQFFRQVVAIAPDHAPARLAGCMAHLPPLYDDQSDIDARRRNYAEALDGLATYAERAGADALADGIGAAQPFLLTAQGRLDADLQRRYGTLVCGASAARFGDAPLAAPPRLGERLRLGIVCGFLRDHSVWRIPTRGWIEGLDRTRFELFAYHTGTERDAETIRLESLFDRFAQGPYAISQWRDRIIADQPHALLYPEIGMDPVAVRLAAQRLAPVQLASWGHPSTTGLPTIDLFLSADLMEPDGADAHYTERLVRLPGLSSPIAPPEVARRSTRFIVGVREDQTVFWCGQPVHKYLPIYDTLLADIAQRVPAAAFVFVVFTRERPLQARFRARLAAAFRDRGLDPAAHLVFVPEVSAAEHRERIGCADLMLDSVGWSGCNSVIEALGQGIPVVTWPGSTMRSRHAAALLATLGADELIAADGEHYVALAAWLGQSPRERGRIGAMLQAGLARFADRSAVTALEACLWSACSSASK